MRIPQRNNRETLLLSNESLMVKKKLVMSLEKKSPCKGTIIHNKEKQSSYKMNRLKHAGSSQTRLARIIS